MLENVHSQAIVVGLKPETRPHILLSGLVVEIPQGEPFDVIDCLSTATLVNRVPIVLYVYAVVNLEGVGFDWLDGGQRSWTLLT